MVKQILKTDLIVSKRKESKINEFVKNFLVKYGYMKNCKDSNKKICSHITKALQNFQSFSRLEPTGSITAETMKLMRVRRCPIKDLEPAQANGPGIEDSDPFSFRGLPWDTTQLKWYLKSGTSDMSGEPDIIQQAFDKWAAFIPLTFSRTYTESEANFVISWEIGDHGDGSDFDGEGDILAHAFYPQNGRIHFDDSESWGDGSCNFLWWGCSEDLLPVAIHEIGHALGLKHSGNSDSVMWPYIHGAESLHEDDVRGIKSLYPHEVFSSTNDFVRVNLYGLKNTYKGTDVRTIDLGQEKRVLAWGQITMQDSLNDLDRDNAYSIEVYSVDGSRPGPYVYGGDHWGSNDAPSNVHTGAWIGRAQKITFRLSSIHTKDLDVFGTGNVLILDG